MGIHFSHSGEDLCGNRIWIEDRGISVEAGSIITGPRIGIDYAGEDALLPYRFKLNAK
jgi:DNA-3-methyladenine glycosylase